MPEEIGLHEFVAEVSSRDLCLARDITALVDPMHRSTVIILLTK